MEQAQTKVLHASEARRASTDDPRMVTRASDLKRVTGELVKLVTDELVKLVKLQVKT